MPIPPFLLGLTENTANQAASGILGMTLGSINDRRQLKQQQRLQEQQIAGQKQMGEFNLQQQLKLWEATNFQAQKAQLQKAGLNPALIYGMGGAGGATASAQPGQVTAGNAPTGGREIQDLMGMGMQRQLLQAQKENIEADTQNKLAELPNKPLQGNVLKAQEKDLLQGVENKKQQELFQKIQNRMAEVDALFKQDITESNADKIYWEMRKAKEEFQIAEQEAWLSRELRNEKATIMEQQALEAAVRVEAAKKGVKLTEEQITNLKQSIQIQKDQFDFNKWAKEQELKQIGWDKALTGAIISAAKALGIKIQDEKPN